ncbi:MAG: DUF5357 family protein [Nodosilinea sp.]
MLKFLRETLQSLIDALLPDRYFAWQTVLYMSLFSWLMSLIAQAIEATTFTVGLLATLSWMLLAIGVGWGIEASNIRPFGIPIAPWVSGAIVCIFLFGSWGGSWLQPALATWPLISFAVAAAPSLLSWELKPKKVPPAVRQRLVLLFFLSLLFSSWFQFYFRIQGWLQDYPSLAADNFDQSNFVFRIPGQPAALSAGEVHLSAAAELIATQVEGKPWPSVERWLANKDGQQQILQQQLADIQTPSQEDALWRLDLQPLRHAEGYTLNLRAVWLGPAADPAGYYLEKSCQLMPVSQGAVYDTTPAGVAITPQWAALTCDLETTRHPGPPSMVGRRS